MFRTSDLIARLFDRSDDVRIRAATADIAAHPLADLGVAAGVTFMDAGDGRTNLPGSAVTALESVVLDEGGLHRMEPGAVGEPFNRGDLVAFVHDGEAETAVNSSAVDQNGAGAALPVIAALLRSGELEMFPQQIEKRGPRIHFQTAVSPVYFQLKIDHACEFVRRSRRRRLRAE